MSVNLKAKPFNLSDSDVEWVETTLQSLTISEKVGQLFCNMGVTDDENQIRQMTEGLGLGGIMYRPMKAENVLNAHRLLQKYSKVPMLLAANLEAGGNGAAAEGTNYAKPMGVAATDDEQCGYELGKIACSEGAALGLNWAFAPIVDIDMNFRNPITNLRTFGSNPDTVIKMAKGYLRAADEEGLAVSIKHFPGDGVDERDQHLVTSVNSLSCEEWDKTYGKVYSELIEAGAKTVMVGHIAQPAYQEKFGGKKELIPATLSKAIMTDLLRGKLKFNGLISTDASQMMGFCTAMKREIAVPTAIASGADVFLFSKDLLEDFGFMMKGVQSGILSMERLDEAVLRILALKASLHLHEKKANGTLVPNADALAIVGCAEHKEMAKRCADKAVTLVKDTQNLLPISPDKTKRIYLNVIENNDDVNSPMRTKLKARLEKEGFAVTVRDRDISINIGALMSGEQLDEKSMRAMAEVFTKVEDFTKDFDLSLYVADFDTISNNVMIRLNWKAMMGMGNDAPWYCKEVPMMFVSLGNPYHTLDVPMIPTFINAYTDSDEVIDAVVEKMMGRSKFKGKNPVDPFCGKWDTTL